MKKIFIVILFLSLESFTQNVCTVEGFAPGAVRCRVAIKVYDDQLTFTYKKLTSCVTDSAGHFKLSATLYKPVIAELFVEQHRASIVLTPGKGYHVLVGKMNYDSVYEHINPYLEEPQLAYTFQELPEQDLNNKVSAINEVFNSFLQDNFFEKRPFGAKLIVEGFIKKMNDQYAVEDQKFIREYLRYKLASLDFMVNLSSRQALFRQYLYKQHVQYDNPEYMAFFNAYFDKYLTAVSPKISYWELKEMVNNGSSVAAILDTLGRDSLLINETIRELVLLNGAYEFYYNPDFQSHKVLELLYGLSRDSKFVQHRRIAENMIALVTKLKPGARAPEFFLQDQDKLIINLEHKKGKYIYMGFWKTTNPESIREIERIEDLSVKYSNDIEFVCVSVDRRKERMLQYMQGKAISWHFIHYDGKEEIIENYAVTTTPLFVLIDREGRIMKYPAPLPSDGIDRLFMRLTAPVVEKQFKMFEK